jgi:elongation factor 2
VQGEEPVAGTPLVNLKAFLPVAESFGFTQALRAATSGRAFPQCVFDHWEELGTDPLEDGSKAQTLAQGIRTRKGLKPVIPSLDNFIDKL